MKVVQVVTDQNRRGAQVYATDLDVGLRALGIDVVTVALAPGDHDAKLDVEPLGPSRRSPATARALRKVCGDADVVVAHGSTTLPMSALSLAGMRCPVVYRQISDPLFWAATPLRRRRTALLLRRVSRVVTLSRGTATTVIDHFGLDPGRVTTIPNAVPGAAHTVATVAERGAARGRLGLPESAVVVLSIGALVPEKGTADVIDALEARDDVVLVVAGDGPERDALEARASAALGSRARFVGSIPDPVDLYRAADVVVLASRGGDSMPAVVIEAGLHGLPVVSCPVGAITDVVIDGRTGVIVPSGSVEALGRALADLADRPGRANELGAAARSFVEERFTIEGTAPMWSELLTEVAASPRPRVRVGGRP